MKKLILLFSMLLSGVVLFSQTTYDLQRNASKTYRVGYTYAQYKGVAGDSLTTNQDTIDVVFNMRVDNGAEVQRISVGTTFDLRTVSDTVVQITVFAEDFDGDTYTGNTVISATNSTQVTVSNLFTPFETASTTSIAQYNSVTAQYVAANAGWAGVETSDTTALFPYAGAADSAFIYSATTANAAHNITHAAQTTTNAAQTVTNARFTWRKYVVRLVYPAAGDDTGTGVLIDPTNGIELKLYTN